MKTLVLAMVAAGVGLAGPVSAQAVDPRLSRELGRAVGEAAVQAERAADEMRAAAREAARGARQGYEDARGAEARGAGGPPPVMTEDDAAEACALAAEDEGYAIARLASVRQINRVWPVAGADGARPGGSGAGGSGWGVEGVIELRDSWRAPRGREMSFRCTIAGGEVVDVTLRDFVARR
ncbi:hypothetical protein GVO57_09905 [Sphingomonas changnyeongensis]|uniref:Uncharacterized protein n=1 Tax=Sphingomonas changnyeongensis TaxID=2698679 RepID=A0A7Z2NX77_9SPHN|nr:hypothetical protein [Sphingomonas changnyeongensis]QHL91074.1 hypothetical protein GVO57_09905 [Sphingomonas changnyeongensis]